MTRFFISIVVFLISIVSIAQPTEQQRKLEEQKLQIQKEIETYRQLLQNENKKEKSVLSEIASQKARIRLSEKLIATTAKQKRLLDDNIYLTQLEINKLNRELKVLKDDYTKMIVKSYKSRNAQSRIMFVLSSQNFLQAYKRIQYMKQYAGFRKMQGDEIKDKQIKLEESVVKLETNKKEKEKVLEESEAEKQVLEKQKIEQEKLVKIIQKDKKKYAADIDKKQKEAKAIDNQIKKLIAEAIAEANRKNAVKTGVKTSPETASTKFVLTAEGKIVSDNFKANKGKLPWPVEKGYVQLRFGKQPHPVHSNLTVDNSGVEIATESGSNARAIFDGEVMQIQLIKGTNRKIVYIQHGDFITIYQNLETVNVREGEKVSIKQNLGRIYTDASGKAILKLLVMQNVNVLNPEQWLFNM